MATTSTSSTTPSYSSVADALNINDVQGNNFGSFINNYRDALDRQYAASVNNVEQQKRNDEATIVSNANVAGSMYSNFPQRDKLKYQTSTYVPNLQSAHTTYQTGLDDLRSNAASVYNNIQSVEEAIANLNELTAKANSSSTSSS